MALSSKYFGKFFTAVGNKEHDLDTDVYKLMLTTSSYTPDQDVHDYKNDVTNEVSGTGYTAGGATVGSIAMSYNAGTNVWSFDGLDVSWSSATIANARYAVLYNSSPGSDATRGLVLVIDLDANISVTAGTLTIQWNASGIGTVTVS